MRRVNLLAAIVLVTAGCTSLLFHPMREHLLTPDRLGLVYRDVWFEAEDGVRLHGWFLPARGTATGTVLFLHGNAENISTHIASVAWLPGAGFNVFLIDYRGYGLSEGSPSFDGLHRDVAAAIETAFKLAGGNPERVVLFGQSLGGALAITALARSRQRERLRALVVEGAPSSYRGLAQEKLAEFWLTWPLQVPLSWTIDDRYRPLDAIAQVAPVPILIIQGGADPIVPPAHGKALFAAAREPKTLWLLPHTGHIRAFVSEENRNRLIDYLRTVDAGSTLGRHRAHAEVDGVNLRQTR
jgi:fermentation-respiration switch protein FrsA (DUF1100 family)